METDNKDNKNNHQDSQGIDKADGSHSFGDGMVNYNGIEANYSWPFIDKRALQPSGIYHWNSRGTQLRSYLRVNYKAMSDPTFELHYRYDYDTHKTVSNTGESHQDNINRLDLHVAYKFNT